MTSQLEDDQNGRRPKWKTTKMEDDQNGRQPKWKMIKMEDYQNGRRPKWIVGGGLTKLGTLLSRGFGIVYLLY